MFLNIYQLDSFDKYNGYLVPVGLGAYHSGVEVYGEEISFGYHDDNSTGVFIIDPRAATDCTFVYEDLLRPVSPHTGVQSLFHTIALLTLIFRIPLPESLASSVKLN